MEWWSKRHGQRLRAPTIRGFLEKHLRAKLGPIPLHQITAERYDAETYVRADMLDDRGGRRARAAAFDRFRLGALAQVTPIALMQGAWPTPRWFAAGLPLSSTGNARRSG